MLRGKVIGASRSSVFSAFFWMMIGVFAAFPSSQPRAEDATPPGIAVDADSFTAHAAALFSKAMPAYKVTVAGPLALSIAGLPSGRPFSADLQMIYSFCQRNADHCEAGLAAHVERLSSSVPLIDAPVDRTRLRAIVRLSAQVELAEQMLPGRRCRSRSRWSAISG